MSGTPPMPNDHDSWIWSVAVLVLTNVATVVAAVWASIDRRSERRDKTQAENDQRDDQNKAELSKLEREIICKQVDALFQEAERLRTNNHVLQQQVIDCLEGRAKENKQ